MTPLRIAILAELHSPTIAQRLIPHLESRGHTVDIIDVSSVPIEDFIDQPIIQSLSSYDLVYYRSGLDPDGNSTRILELEAFLEKNPVMTVNLHYTEHPQAHSKTYEATQAQRHGLTIPKSIFTKEDFISLQNSLGLPFIAKTDQGTKGDGVHMIKDETSFNEISTKYQDTPLLFQEFVPHDFEYRVHVIDKAVVCIYKKAPPENDFRSNEAQGGEMIEADSKYTEELTNLLNTTCKAFSFEIFVADFMLNKNTDTFYFTEINLNPGWEDNDQVVTGVDMMSLTADYFEKACSK